MKNIPTIDDLSHRYLAFFQPRTGYEAQPNIRHMMLEFTRAHVEAALKKASEKIKSDALENYGTEVCDCWEVESILNAYPLENIK